MKLGQLKRIIKEEARKHLNERTLGVSDSLNHLIGFAEVFANLPRRIRLDVMRVVEYEHESVDPENISQALDVLHGLDVELDAALEAYIDEYASANESAQLDEVDELEEVAPPGMEKMVKGLKKSKTVDNPWAVAWARYGEKHGKRSKKR